VASLKNKPFKHTGVDLGSRSRIPGSKGHRTGRLPGEGTQPPQGKFLLRFNSAIGGERRRTMCYGEGQGSKPRRRTHTRAEVPETSRLANCARRSGSTHALTNLATHQSDLACPASLSVITRSSPPAYLRVLQSHRATVLLNRYSETKPGLAHAPSLARSSATHKRAGSHVSRSRVSVDCAGNRERARER
jgi:hypothetical protein